MKRSAPSGLPRASKRERVQHDLPNSITAAQRSQCLARYPELIPEDMVGLDRQRFETIPNSVSKRAKPHLTKVELVTLVEWKLKHGTFRPTLLGMAKSHDADLIIQTTSNAFAEEDVIKGLRILTALKGIGPATASLLLSCRNRQTPFFSDELFRWMMWDEPGGFGWDRKIRYTEKEYRMMEEKVRGFLESQEDFCAYDLEKVAYVLAREARGE